jgi:Tfp pilus assembly protein PilW
MNPKATDRTHAAGAPTHARGGFTLIEAVLGTAIAVIILAGIVGVMFIAYQGLSSGADKADRMSRQSRAIQMITLDLSLATALSEQSAEAVTLVVPDRNGDGQPETIRYYWSGTPGDPLTRQVNGSPAAVIAEDVTLFSLTYLLRAVSPQAFLMPADAPWLAFCSPDDQEACP